MNTSLKTVVSLALVVVLSAGLAMAGRGGGGGHGGGGGGGMPAAAEAADSTAAEAAAACRVSGGGGGYHTPSFSTPRQSFNTPRPSFNTPRPAETPASRPSLPQNVAANRGQRQPASGLELPTRPIGTTA